jgi:hypothetical protein
MDSIINQQENIQDVNFVKDEEGSVCNVYPWQKGFLWPWQKEFCLPCWVGITILLIFVFSLFIPFFWYVINCGLN